MFLFIPVDGWPQVIDADPTGKRMSDLMGAIPFATAICDDRGLMVCEDQAGRPLNIGASFLMSLLNDSTMAITGPVCMLAIGGRNALSLHDGGGLMVAFGKNASLPADEAHTLARAVEDALYAERGDDSKIQPGGENGEFSPEFRAQGIRKALALLRQLHEAAVMSSAYHTVSADGIGPVFI